MLGLLLLSVGQTARLLVQSAPSPSPARPQDQDRPCGRPVARSVPKPLLPNPGMPSRPAGRHLPELGFACAEAEGSPLFTHQVNPLCSGDTYAGLSSDKVCQLWLDAGHACSSRWNEVCATDHPDGAGKNACTLSTVGCAQCGGGCMSHYESSVAACDLGDTSTSTDLTRFCSGECNTALTSASTECGGVCGNPDIKGWADYYLGYCSPDTCHGAMAALDFSACGPAESKTPATGACASSACAALVDSFTDAKVEQMAAGFASCTGDHAAYSAYFADGVDSVKAYLNERPVGQCGLTAPFTPPSGTYTPNCIRLQNR